MATKPKPKPEPKPDPDEDEAAATEGGPPNVKATGPSLFERVAALEERMTKLEAEAKEPPIRLGSARAPKPGWP